MSESAQPTVLAQARNGVGHLTLNRPAAINALDIDMLRGIAAALDEWEHDSEVDIVVLDGAGDRGFCAGGDVRALAQQIRDGDPSGAAQFFREEYSLNARIGDYPKPVVALADGVTMGGGIGLAGHAAIRVVTERSKLAMPETRIGLTPDVGGSWLLAKAPGRLGEYLALTGAVMDAADAVYAGFADHLVPSAHLGDLVNALETRADPSSPTELVFLFDDTPAPSHLESAREWIDDAFAADSVPEIVERLRARGEDAASATADLLGELSPTALAVTLESVRRARTLGGLREALAQEFGLVMWFVMTQPDLVEGVRAQLIDKDRAPKWNPATITDVDPAAVENALAYSVDPALWA